MVLAKPDLEQVKGSAGWRGRGRPVSPERSPSGAFDPKSGECCRLSVCMAGRLRLGGGRRNRPSRIRDFAELFAGTGVLSRAVSESGIPTDWPNEASEGGTDFRDEEQVELLRCHLRSIVADGQQLVLHIAPPCHTFSRAKDRSGRTRVRSREKPDGLEPASWEVIEANVIARNAYSLARWAREELKAFVSMENPESSYLWLVVSDLDQASDKYSDVVFSPCCFGADVQKHTKLRCWGWLPSSLSRKCTVQGE